MRNLLRATGIFGFFFVYHLAAAYAATAHLPENYFYQRADVTGDGRDELIAQPARAGDEAYVLFATGADSWEGVWQRLNDIDPRLAWDSESATLIVGDFNGDGRDDLYVQARAPGSAHALLLADESGQFTQIHHLFSDERLGLEWHGEARRLLAGDFNGDGRDELLLQGLDTADVHVIFHANESADFNTSGASWIEGHLGLRWSAPNAELYSGDLNGDGRDDLLWRRSADASPRADEPAVAMLLANMQGEFDEVSQQWEEDFLGAEWDPATHRIELRDITGDGIADIILMARSASGTHYLVPGRLDGKLIEVAMRWTGTQSAEAAWASQNPGRADIVVNPVQAEMAAADSSTLQTLAQQSSSGSPLPGNEVGTLAGEFSVDPTGAANYRIPIEVPPGVGGMQTRLFRDKRYFIDNRFGCDRRQVSDGRLRT
ncbi:MAG TPA: VCBS repeat-containing protein [Gammaproteobacteria bacterium]|nr:VCBS repeat-containing protein [Gammaproteobacteria bacterium]